MVVTTARQFYCPNCHGEVQITNTFCPHCGHGPARPPAAPATGSQGPYVSTTAMSPVRYGGFWRRCLAWTIDVVLISAAFSSALILLTLLLRLPVGSLTNQINVFSPDYNSGAAQPWMVVLWILGGVYWAMCESSRHQATLGKIALGLVVTDVSGQRISLLRASLRYVSKQVNVVTLGVGYFMAGWTHQKQALHDKMTSCVVVRRPG
jgi:uncharacterized RDD family membrane protein YckC